MEFKLNRQTGTATSDCGYYEIKSALTNGKPYYNSFYKPTQRSIEGTFDKDQAKRACQKHAEKMARLKGELTGVAS